MLKIYPSRRQKPPTKAPEQLWLPTFKNDQDEAMAVPLDIGISHDQQPRQSFPPGSLHAKAKTHEAEVFWTIKKGKGTTFLP